MALRASSLAAPASARRVVVTGGAGSLGERVLARLAEATWAAEVRSLDLTDAAPAPPSVETVAADLGASDLRPLLAGADTVVHLAFANASGDGDERLTAAGNLAATRRLLAAAEQGGVEAVVLVSSATVYGAWPTNPVPLTEDAPVRPNPDFAYAATRAEVERLGAEWARQDPGRRLAVLRPAPTLADGHEGWLATALRQSSGIRPGGANPPAQFLHLDDLAAAVVLAVEGRLDGAYNVAPDGWVTAEQVRALAGGPPRLPVPERVASAAARLAWRWRMARTPPGLAPYAAHPFVVANDRLEAEGWRPTSSSEEAYVVAHRGTPWSRLSPKRRQELALGASVATLLGALAGAAALVRRRQGRRPSAQSAGRSSRVTRIVSRRPSRR